MILIPIEEDDSKNQRFANNSECASILDMQAKYYSKIGFHKPWIGYLASFDGKEVVGVGGYKGKPKDERVEIA